MRTRLEFRRGAEALLGLPWDRELASWDVAEVPLCDVPVGQSRHLVRFVEGEHARYALKELPTYVATREHAVLRELERRGLPAVRVAGLVDCGESSVLVTTFLERSWQFQRLLTQLPPRSEHRDRLLEGLAGLLVELHRNGVYWGDASLANTLFVRDGQQFQAHLVDAETSEVHAQLSAGQRAWDLELATENVAAALLDVAAQLELPEEDQDELVDAALWMRGRYEALWEELHQEQVVPYAQRHEALRSLQGLRALGFEVEGVHVEPQEGGRVRVRPQVAARTHHRVRLQALTGLTVPDGQARILLGDLESYLGGHQGDTAVLARCWVQEVLMPGITRAQQALGSGVDSVQAYCDLLEVRWLLSEQAGEDVGDQVALTALTAHTSPPGSAAQAAVVDLSS